MNIGEYFFEEPLINIHEGIRQTSVKGYFRHRKDLNIKEFSQEISNIEWCFPYRVQRRDKLVDDTTNFYKLSEYKFWYSQETYIKFTKEVEEFLIKYILINLDI